MSTILEPSESQERKNNTKDNIWAWALLNWGRREIEKIFVLAPGFSGFKILIQTLMYHVNNKNATYLKCFIVECGVQSGHY